MENNLIDQTLISPYRIVLHDIDDSKNKQFDHKLNCTICGREFYSRKYGKYWTQTCGACDLYVTCANEECKKENLVTDHPTRVLQNVKNNKPSCCDSDCLTKAKIQIAKKKVCSKCGGNHINIMGKCMDCHNKEINKSVICPVHGFQENSFGGECIRCINEEQHDRLVDLAIQNCEKANNGFWKTEEGKELRKEIFKKNTKIHLEYCEVCQEETNHRGNICLICNPESNGFCLPIFLEKGDILYFYDSNSSRYSIWSDFKEENEINDNTVIQKIIELELQPALVKQLQKEYPNHAEFQNYSGAFLDYNGEKYLWYEKEYVNWSEFKEEFEINDDNVIEKIIELELSPIVVNQLKVDYPNHIEFQRYQGSLINFNEINYIWQNGQYIDFDEFCEDFKTHNVNFELPEDFELISTFRKQDSQDWSGAREPFENYLLKENVGWFTYIKFYINEDGLILPLVGGKTGSRKFNENTDVVFDKDPDGGLARQFLIKENLDWDKTQIAIRRCTSEEEALRIEKEIQDEYGLFGS